MLLLQLLQFLQKMETVDLESTSSGSLSNTILPEAELEWNNTRNTSEVFYLFLRKKDNLFLGNSSDLRVDKTNFLKVELKREFDSKWPQNDSFFCDNNKHFVKCHFLSLIDHLLQIDPDYIVFQFTEDATIYFQSLIQGNDVYCELCFDLANILTVEALANIYRNGNSVLLCEGTIESIVRKITSTIQKSTNGFQSQFRQGIIPYPFTAPSGIQTDRRFEPYTELPFDPVYELAGTY
jgi:hypothetical protein